MPRTRSRHICPPDTSQPPTITGASSHTCAPAINVCEGTVSERPCVLGDLRSLGARGFCGLSLHHGGRALHERGPPGAPGTARVCGSPRCRRQHCPSPVPCRPTPPPKPLPIPGPRVHSSPGLCCPRHQKPCARKPCAHLVSWVTDVYPQDMSRPQMGRPYLCLWRLFWGWVIWGPSPFCKDYFASFWLSPVELQGGERRREGEQSHSRG